MRTKNTLFPLILLVAMTAISATEGAMDPSKAAATITAGEIKTHLKYLASDELGGRLGGSEGERKAAEYVAKEFKEYGLKPAGDGGSYLQKFPVWEKPGSPNVRDSWNVVGIIEGSDDLLKNEIVVIGAHHDHIGVGNGLSSKGITDQIHNGADDNASGTSAILELAEAFAGLATKPKRSILFITFSGEELGFVGSSHYINNPPFPLERHVLMINLDMIGRCRDDTVLVQGVGTSRGLNDAVTKANATLSMKIETMGKGPMLSMSDTASFHRKDIPVLAFFTGMHGDYHAPTDDWEKINYEGEEKIARLVFGTAWELANRPKKIEPAPSEEKNFPAYVALHQEGKYEEAIAGFKKIHEQNAGDPTGALAAYNVACGYALLKDTPAALDWLEKAVNAGFNNAAHVRQDSDLDGLRDEERYKTLLKNLEER